MGSPLPVGNEPSDQPPLPEPTTAANPQQQKMTQSVSLPPAADAPLQCPQAPLSPAPEFSVSESFKFMPLPPLISKSVAPEPGSENNPVPPLSILASIASETPKSVVLESETEKLCQSTAEDNLHKPLQKDTWCSTNSLNQETSIVSCSARGGTADTISHDKVLPANHITSEPPLKKTRIVLKIPKSRDENPSPVQRRPRTKRKSPTKTVPPRNQITSESHLKKTRTKRQTSEPGCENQIPAQKRPRTKKKPPTTKKPHSMRKTPGGLTVVSRPDTDRNPNREIEIEASQIDTNGGDEVSDRPVTKMAPPESDTRNSQTPAPPDVKTQDTPSVQKVIPISVYAGGEVRFNQMGAEYSIHPMFTFAGTQQTTFEDVRNEINNCLKLSEDQYSLNIQARYNAVPTGPFFFTLLAINDDRAWRLIYEMAVSGLNWRVIELYVKLVPNQSSHNANPDPTQAHGTSRMPCTLMHAIPSPLEGSCMRPSVPNNPSPAIPGNSSKAQWCMPMHDNLSQAAPCNSAVVSTFQYSIPGIFNRFTQGQGPSPSELILFANVGSFSANQIFKSKKHLWFAITDLHIKANIEIAVTSSSESELVVRCKNKRCQWKLHANPTRVCSNWTIKSCLYPHTCHEATSTLIQPELSVEIIARIIRLDIQQGSELKIIKLHELVLKRFPGAHASYNNLWHARKIVIEELFGGWEESYAVLPRLFEAIRASNPETKFDLQSDSMTQSGNKQFNRVAWAFGPCIKAYCFLRPVISVKALSLLGKYDGRLLIACGYDADNEPVPIAFALVNEETESNWTWFIRFLRQKVIGHNQLVCAITDCDGCIKNAFEGPDNYSDKAIRQTVHRFCLQNVADCLSKVCKDIELIDIFKSAAQKTSRQKFEEGRNAIRIRSPEAYLYLERLGERKAHDQYEQSTTVKWAQYEDSGCRYGIMNSNCSETVKKVFKGCRHLPLAAIVENTFSNCMRLFSQRKQNAAEQVAAGKVRPDTVTEILQKRGDKAQEYYVNFVFNKKMYEVGVKRMRDYGLTFLKYNVTVASRSAPECECQKLKFTGIPCSHVIAVCRKLKVDPKRFVNSYYSLQMLENTWSADFHQYGNKNEWPEYNGAVIVPNKTLLRTRPEKPEDHKDNGENSGQKQD